MARLTGFEQTIFAYAGGDIRLIGPRGDQEFHEVEIFAIDPDVAESRSLVMGNPTFTAMGFSAAGGFQFLDNLAVPPLQDDGSVRDPKIVKVEPGSDLEKFFKLNPANVTVVSTFRDRNVAGDVDPPGSEF